jgi:hypothetical protein
MVFVQVLVNSANVNLYPIGIHGNKTIKLIGLFHHQANGNAFYNVRLQSNSLVFPYGNCRNITYMIKNNDVNFYNFEDLKFNCNLNGNLEIGVYDVATNAALANFGHLILYLEISD